VGYTRQCPYRAAKSERASKIALSEWCQENGWKVVFFESATGSPRTGVVDAVIVRIKPREPDAIEVRLVQLKSGGAEIADRSDRCKTLIPQYKFAKPVSFEGLAVAFLSWKSRSKRKAMPGAKRQMLF
jgi:hypothetical protein